MASVTRDDLHKRIQLLTDPHLGVLEHSSNVMEGLTVFCGTRVPARTLFDT